MFLKYKCLYRKTQFLWRIESVLYIELFLCVILIFKINRKFIGPNKVYLSFIEFHFYCIETQYSAHLCKN
jgi:hypothetical protein